MARNDITTIKYPPKSALAEFMGTNSPMRPCDVISEIWAYARKKKLKTMKVVKGRNWGAIKSDAVLRPILGSGVSSAAEIMSKVHMNFIKPEKLPKKKKKKKTKQRRDQ